MLFTNNLARRTGLEPATLGVTGRYSNQLSYHRVYINYNTSKRYVNEFGSSDKNWTCNDRLSADCYTI